MDGLGALRLPVSVVGAYVASLTARDLGLTFLVATALGVLAAATLSGMLASPRSGCRATTS